MKRIIPPIIYILIMNASIQISKETLEKLNHLKIELNAATFDDLINQLINMAQITPQTMFGIDKDKISKFSVQERFDFR